MNKKILLISLLSVVLSGSVFLYLSKNDDVAKEHEIAVEETTVKKEKREVVENIVNKEVKQKKDTIEKPSETIEKVEINWDAKYDPNGVGFQPDTFLPFYTVLDSVEDVGWDITEELPLPHRGYFSNILPIQMDTEYLKYLARNNKKIPNIIVTDAEGNEVEMLFKKTEYEEFISIKGFPSETFVFVFNTNSINSYSFILGGAIEGGKELGFDANLYSIVGDNGVVNKIYLRNGKGYVVNNH